MHRSVAIDSGLAMNEKTLPATGGGPRVVEIKKGVFSRYPKKETGSWQESDRGGTRLWGRVHNMSVQWKVFLDLIS